MFNLRHKIHFDSNTFRSVSILVAFGAYLIAVEKLYNSNLEDKHFFT